MKAGAVKVYGFESKFQEKALNCFNFKRLILATGNSQIMIQ